jgi:hypothetical protein
VLGCVSRLLGIRGDRLLLKSYVYLGWSGWISMFVQLFGVAFGMDVA